LRDGTQAAGVSLSIEDKIRIAIALDDLGIDYIEGGWPGSNPKDSEFFKEIKRYGLAYSKVVAFGSTRRKDLRVDNDPNIYAIIKADVDVAVLFGKAWTLHVRDILRAPEDVNLNMIYESIDYLKSHGIEVLFDAEHFYQGFKDDPEYALEVIMTAEQAGASAVILADTTGSTTPMEIYDITRRVSNHVKVKIGLHMHNDIGCAVANTLMGVVAGARHVQGTINGIGERAGNADLVQVLPTLAFKMNFKVLKDLESFKKLREVSQLVYRLTGVEPNPYQPYVGEYAFAHKAGIHVDAVLKNPRAYEHIDPSVVGNNRIIVVSELSGVSNIIALLKDLGIDLNKRDERIRKALMKIKSLEKQGYAFNTAPASAILEVLRELGVKRNIISRYSWTIFTDSTGASIAIVNLNEINDRATDIDAITALKKAFEEAVRRLLSNHNTVKTSSFSVLLLPDGAYRVTVGFTDGFQTWATQGVSMNMIDALIKALIDGIEYYSVVRELRKTDINGSNIATLFP